MNHEHKPYTVRWQTATTTEGLEFQQIIGSWSISPLEITRLLESPVGEPYRQQTLNVLTEGWEQMAAIIKGGGMTTGLGTVFDSVQLPVAIPRSLSEKVEKEGMYTARAIQLEEDYFIELDELDIRNTEHVNFVCREFQERIIVLPDKGPMYRTSSGKPAPLTSLQRSFVNMFKNLYAQAEIPPVVASASATNTMLGYMAHTSGTQ